MRRSPPVPDAQAGTTFHLLPDHHQGSTLEGEHVWLHRVLLALRQPHLPSGSPALP